MHHTCVRHPVTGCLTYGMRGHVTQQRHACSHTLPPDCLMLPQMLLRDHSPSPKTCQMQQQQSPA
jgi:hypothetical protein